MLTAGDFVMVEGRVEVIRPDAISFARPLEAAHWIPRSLLHHQDRAGIDGLAAGEVARLRIRKWKADQLGLAAAGDADAADLFAKGRPLA